MDQQLRAMNGRSCGGPCRPLEDESYAATQIQALTRGFLCRRDSFVIEVRPSLQRYASHISALTVEGLSTRSLCSSYQDEQEDFLFSQEHPGFEGSNHEDDFGSPIRKPRRIASTESTGSSLFPSASNNNAAMLTVNEDDEHPGFDSPNSDEEPVKRPTRLLSTESMDSRGRCCLIMDEGDLLFSPNTVDAACRDNNNNKKKNKKRTTQKMSKLMQIQEMPFGRGQRAALERRQRPKDRPAVLPIRHRSNGSENL